MLKAQKVITPFPPEDVYVRFGVDNCLYQLPLSQYVFENGAFETNAFESTGDIQCP